VQPELIPESCS